MFKPAQILLLFLLALVASAVPTVSPFTSFQKRNVSTEGYYLVDCHWTSFPGNQSQINYYPNITDFATGPQSGSQPDAVAIVDDKGKETWEGKEVPGTLMNLNGTSIGKAPIGQVFVSLIHSGAQNLTTGENAGTGHDDENNFYCFKDDGRFLHDGYAAQGNYVHFECHSTYYCHT